MSKPKYIVAIEFFIERQVEGMNALDSLTLYGDTCLNSTVSDLSRHYGLNFRKRDEPHQHRGGGSTKFRRYWVENIEQAEMIVTRYKQALTAANDPGLKNDHLCQVPL